MQSPPPHPPGAAAASPPDLPDRSASAPPDLEISSRSLFAFKADYSGIFSDIRLDEDYEGFYYANPERVKLPPPLRPAPLPPRLPRDTPTFRDPPFTSTYEPSSSPSPFSTSVSPSPVPRQPSPPPRDPVSFPSPLVSSPRPRHSSPSPPPVSSSSHYTSRPYPSRLSTAFSSSSRPYTPPSRPSLPSDYALNSPVASPTPRRHAVPPDLARRHDDALWKLRQLSLEDPDPPQSPIQRVYAPVMSYEQPPRQAYTPLHAPYPYRAPHSPEAVAAAAAAAVAAAVGTRDPKAYEAAPVADGAFVGVNGNGMDDMVGYGAYGRGAYPMRNVYGGRRSYDAGGSMHVSGDYVSAQAAAAAAAAAAAVYQSNGVHINGVGGFSPLRSGRMVGRTGRGVEMRRNGGGRNPGGIIDRTSNAPEGSVSGGGVKLSSFNDVIGRAEELARDQHGCRFLQTKLEEGNTMYINSIFEECYEKFVDLMTDPFGNYLCQKLFEYCSDEQRLALVERCAPAIPMVSVNMHGTRAVQRMVECLSTPKQVKVVCDALKGSAVDLMKDINGNHVIQRCLNRLDAAHNQFVYDAVAGSCFELATHRHGCCVMQRCMDFATPLQKNQLASQINANALPLVQNAFGNYVVQYVLEMDNAVYTAEIIERLRGHLAELSMQKFSSNVVEKSLQLSSRETRRELIDELVCDPETMRRLLHDAYGNYVIQRALQVAEGPQLEAICEAIRPHLNSLRQSPYGKRIQAKILKRMPKGMPALSAS